MRQLIIATLITLLPALVVAQPNLNPQPGALRNAAGAAYDALQDDEIGGNSKRVDVLEKRVKCHEELNEKLRHEVAYIGNEISAPVKGRREAAKKKLQIRGRIALARSTLVQKAASCGIGDGVVVSITAAFSGLMTYNVELADQAVARANAYTRARVAELGLEIDALWTEINNNTTLANRALASATKAQATADEAKRNAETAQVTAIYVAGQAYRANRRLDEMRPLLLAVVGTLDTEGHGGLLGRIGFNTVAPDGTRLTVDMAGGNSGAAPTLVLGGDASWALGNSDWRFVTGADLMYVFGADVLQGQPSVGVAYVLGNGFELEVVTGPVFNLAEDHDDLSAWGGWGFSLGVTWRR